MMDESDKNITETALRETHEEIGLPESSIEVWGSMLPLTDSVSVRFYNQNIYHFFILS